MRRIRSVFAALVLTALMVATMAMPAQAQVIGPILVNVDIGPTTIQVPVGVAANLCDINAAVLVQEFQDNGSAECTATAESIATSGPGRGGGPPSDTPGNGPPAR